MLLASTNDARRTRPPLHSSLARLRGTNVEFAMTSASQTQHDDDVALDWGTPQGGAGALEPYVDDRDGCTAGFTGWSLDVACGNAQLW